MRKYTFGELLYRFRIEKNVEAKQICWGLCTQPMMTSYECGEFTPDTLLFISLVERMAISPETFSIMVSQEEYVYHEWKEKVRKTIEESDWEELGELLHSEIAMKTYCNEKIEKQFYLYASAIHFASKENYEVAYTLLEEAIRFTMPDISKLLNANILLNAQELHILMLYLYYGVKSGVVDLLHAKGLFDILEDYTYGENLDITEKTKCYPKLICIGIHSFDEIMPDEEKMHLCEKAIQMLRDGRKFHDITELLRIYTGLLEKYQHEDLKFYRKHYEVFCDLLQSEGISIEFQPEVFVVSKPKIYIISEYLSSKRKANKMTQLKASEGICEPETYSRIENGKRAPSKKNFRALAERLDINWCYFCGELDTSDRRAFELRKQEREAGIKKQWRSVLDVLIQLKDCIDMSLVQNAQYVNSNIYMMQYYIGEMSADKVYELLEKLLYLTQDKDILGVNGLVYYTQTELEIIGFMAQLLRRQGKYEVGIELIENVRRQMFNSKVGVRNQWNGFEFLLRILSGLYFANEEYKTSLDIASYVKLETIKMGEGANVSTILDTIADDLEHMGVQYSEMYKKLYRYTYYTADFFGIVEIVEFIKRYYIEKFDNKIIWYDN